MIKIKTNVMYTQAYGCLLCIHIGSVAVMLGKRDGPCLYRVQVCTPNRWFRFSRSKRSK